MLILFTLMFDEVIDVQAQRGFLPETEMTALKDIAKELRKNDWNYSLNPCDNASNWNWRTENRSDMPSFKNILECNCSYPGGVCHVVSLVLKGQDLDGVLPPSLAKLPHIKKIDLTRNYLNGTIPRAWASTKLEYLSVTVNRLSGRIPPYLGNITSLIYVYVLTVLLSLESNMFSGTIPAELGKLENLVNLTLHANYLSGELPVELNNLTNLAELRISDLSGSGSLFPNLSSLTNMKTLMLRSCNLNGAIPADYLSQMSKLKYLYLTGNSLNGTVPKWIVDGTGTERVVDLSYNHFSKENVPTSCRESLNLFRSYTGGNDSDVASCLGNNPCFKDYYSVYINCGGPNATIGNKVYEADQDPGGNTKFYHDPNSWGFSSTGSQLDVNKTEYISTNVSILTMNNSKLYTQARLSPFSLTYYGRCLANGNYTVTLHFAEIVFRDNQSYKSLGRRAFDVYIQGENVFKDFDIRQKAGGVDKAVEIPITKVRVINKTLEIRLQYAGNGTTAVPVRGVFGPLISAISIESEFKPPTHHKRIFIVLGSVAAALCLILIIAGIAWQRGYIGDRISREEELRGLDLQTGVFTYRQLKAATDNFSESNKLGEGGFGSVYKGALLDGTLIAVKQLSSKSKQGNREFVNEIGMIAGLAFLHEESVLKMVHRDIKATNVLLDTNLTPKISDFGLAKLDEEENTHITTRVAGTIGYMAPEYALWGFLTYKADVYSFGVLALEIVAGKNNIKFQPSEDYFCLLDCAAFMEQKGSLIDLVDPRLGSNFNKKEAVRMMKIALLCTNQTPGLRPTMSEVVNMLEGRTKMMELEDDLRFQPLRGKFEEMHSQKSDDQLQNSDLPTSSSSHDLYPKSEISEETY
ncbi:probable LRR receptor-like serine/threonine-protein kinase isoform X1 [Tanacetum coccineum]